MTGENPKLADRRASGERMLRELLGAAGMARNWLNQARSDDNGLVFDGKLLATSAELDSIFASVSLARELETGRMRRRFNGKLGGLGLTSEWLRLFWSSAWPRILMSVDSK
jgi:hypothetical protein